MHAGEIKQGLVCWAVWPDCSVNRVTVAYRDSDYVHVCPVGGGIGTIPVRDRDLHATEELALLGSLENARTWLLRQEAEVARVKAKVEELRQKLSAR